MVKVTLYCSYPIAPADIVFDTFGEVLRKLLYDKSNLDIDSTKQRRNKKRPGLEHKLLQQGRWYQLNALAKGRGPGSRMCSLVAQPKHGIITPKHTLQTHQRSSLGWALFRSTSHSTSNTAQKTSNTKHFHFHFYSNFSLTPFSICFAVTLQGIDYGIIIPSMLEYMTSLNKGEDVTLFFGIVVSVFSLSSLVTAPLFGFVLEHCHWLTHQMGFW